MWKNFITNHVKMSFKKSALIIVGNAPIRLAESVEKKKPVRCSVFACKKTKC